MTDRTRGDLCPGVFRPWPADDGALVRLRVPGGHFTRTTLLALLDVAESYGDGRVHLTKRANLQLRALPHADGVLIVTSKMRAITAVRREDQRAVVEPGVINLDVTKAAAPGGYYYAPDPSSQQICSIGGNVAENSGGAHCLKYGFTTNHVLGADFVEPSVDGTTDEPVQ